MLIFVIKMKLNIVVVKNVIFFIGDGLGVFMFNVVRIYWGQKNNKIGEEIVLEWEKFFYVVFFKVRFLKKRFY